MGEHFGRKMAAAVVAVALAVTATGCSQRNPGSGQGGSTSLASSPTRAAAPAGGEGGNQVGAAKDGVSGTGAEPAGAPQAAGAKTAPSPERFVIRNGNVRMRVDKVQKTVAALRTMTVGAGGQIAALVMATDTDSGQPQPLPTEPDAGRANGSGLPFMASVTILVPAARLDSFRSQVTKLGTVLSESSSDDDVTQQHVDLKARLDNAKAEESRLRAMFDRAGSTTEMLAVERELARVQGDIESMTAQLTSLDKQVSMATLTVELVEPKPIVRPSSGIDWGFGDALTAGIQGMVELLRGALVVVLATAPLWILALAIFFVVRWRLRVRRGETSADEA